MSNYNPVPLSQVRSWVADGSGLNVDDDTQEIDELINSIRETIYNFYHRIKLFDNLYSCHKLECFPVDCDNPCDKCDDFYWGVTAPQGMASISEAWYNKYPLAKRSRWYEGKHGILSAGYGEMQIIPMGGAFATRRPLLTCTKLKIHTESRLDDGKEFFISGMINVQRGESVSQEYHEEYGDLSFNNTLATSVAFASIDTIQMPADLERSVRITDEDGKELVKVNKGNTSPRFRRYKVQVMQECNLSCRPPSGHVALRGARVYVDLTSPTDEVEIGSRNIFKLMAGFKRYEFSTDRKEREIGLQNRALALEELAGFVARYKIGMETEDPHYFNRHHVYRRRKLRRR